MERTGFDYPWQAEMMGGEYCHSLAATQEAVAAAQETVALQAESREAPGESTSPIATSLIWLGVSFALCAAAIFVFFRLAKRR